VRAWLLVRLGSDWRDAVTSVVIDRAVGVGLLIVLGFAVLLLPSGLAALGGYRDVMLGVYCALLLIGAFGPYLYQRSFRDWLNGYRSAVGACWNSRSSRSWAITEWHRKRHCSFRYPLASPSPSAHCLGN
jgi:hypothetical protein